MAEINEEKTQEQIQEEATGQISNLIEKNLGLMYKTYKENGNELKVSLGLSLKGDSTTVMVKSSLSFPKGKVTDELEAEIILGQDNLPGV